MVIHLVLGVLLGATAPAAAPSTGAGTAKAAAANPAAQQASGGSAPAKSGPDTHAYVLDEKTGAVRKVALFSPEAGTTPIVKIGDDTIMLREFADAIAVTHMQGHKGETQQKKKQQFKPVLDRLVTARLIVLDARATGIDDLPEVKKAVADFRGETLRRMVKERAVQGAKANPAEVEQIFDESSIEWKLRSILIAKEEDAKKLDAAVKAGKSFDELAKQLVAEKKAKGNEAAEFVGLEQLLPGVAGAVQGLKVGGVSGPIKLKEGFAVVKLEAVRHPANAEKRARAEETALAREKGRALRRHYEELVKQYVKKDDKLFASLDFEAEKPGFEALLKDQRVLAEIQGAPAITVADLAEQIEQKFFHGVAQAAKSKKVNVEKDNLLELLLAQRLFDAEGARLKLAESPELKNAVADYSNSVVFGTYVQKVVLPNVKVTEPEIKKYFEQHKADYTYPAFYKLEGIGFKNASDAQAAADKLKKGTDLAWIRQNAEGQIKPDDQTLAFGRTLTAKAFPSDLVPILASAKQGDYRLYSAQEGHYVVQVVEYTAPTVQKYQDAREAIGEKVFEEKVNRSIQDFAAKLKKAYKPKVLITKLGN